MRLGTPKSVADRAIHIAVRSRRKNLTRGTPLAVVAAACMQISSKILGLPRTLGFFLPSSSRPAFR